MDSEILYFRRICSGLRKRQPWRGAYDIVRRAAIAFRVMTDRYRLIVAARYQGTKPKAGKFGYKKANPKLMTPRKSLSSIIGMKLPSLSPKALLRKTKSVVYDFAKDYAAPAVSSVYNALVGGSKEYFGNSELEKGVSYVKPKEEAVVSFVKKDSGKGIKPASVDEVVDKVEEKQISEKDFQNMVELSLLVFILSKEKVEEDIENLEFSGVY